MILVIGTDDAVRAAERFAVDHTKWPFSNRKLGLLVVVNVKSDSFQW